LVVAYAVEPIPARTTGIGASIVLTDRTNTAGTRSRDVIEDKVVACDRRDPSGAVKRTQKTRPGRENAPFPVSSKRKGPLGRAIS
jgi:hypothetical protein